MSRQSPSRIFLCYAREDTRYCDQLVAALREREVEVLWDRTLSPTLDYAEQIRNMVRSADSFGVVLTPASVTSSECESEMQYAVSLGKRLIPILRDPAFDSAKLPERIRKVQWCLAGSEQQFEAAVAQILQALQTNAELVPMHTLIVNRAEEWEAKSRDRRFLLGDPLLIEAEGWLVRTADSGELPQPAALHREYLHLSRREATRLGRRFRVRVYSVILILIVAFGVAVVFKVQSDRNAIRADQNAAVANERSRNLLEEQGRQDLLAGRWDSAAVLLVEARRMGSASPGMPLMLGASMAPLSGVTASMHGGDSPITVAELSTDGRRLAVGGTDGIVRVWEIESGRLEAVLGPHEGRVEEVHLNRDGSRALAVCGAMDLEVAEKNSRIYRPSIRLWNVTEKKPIGDWPLSVEYFEASGVQGPRVEIRPDRNSFVIPGMHDEVFSFHDGRSVGFQTRKNRPSNTTNGRIGTPSTESRPTAFLDVLHHGGGRLLTRRGDGSIAASTGADNRVALSNMKSWRTTLLVHSVMRHARIAFRDTGSDLVALSPDGVFRRISADNAISAEITVGGPMFALSPDGHWAAGLKDGVGVLLDLSRLPMNTDGLVVDELRGFSGARFAPNSRFVLTWEASGNRTQFGVWDFDSYRYKRNGIGSSAVAYELFGVTAVSNAGRDFMAAGQLVTRFWHGRSQSSGQSVPRDAAVVFAEYSPDGKRLAMAMTDGSILVREVSSLGQVSSENDRPSRRLYAHLGGVAYLSFDAASNRMASAGDDGTARLWDLETGALLATCRGHAGSVLSVQFSREGGLLATGGQDGTARVWEVPSCRELLRFPDHSGPVTAALFDGGATRLSTSDGHAIRVWDLTRETRTPAELSSILERLTPVCLLDGRLGLRSMPDQGATQSVCRIR